MMYDNLLNKQSTCIGYSFVKHIAVGKTFSYFISKSDTEFYAKRIVIIKKKEVEECLRIQIDERCFFNLSCIFLTEKNDRKWIVTLRPSAIPTIKKTM